MSGNLLRQLRGAVQGAEGKEEENGHSREGCNFKIPAHEIIPGFYVSILSELDCTFPSQPAPERDTSVCVEGQVRSAASKFFLRSTPQR